jgi:hypothetical protein
MADCIQAQMVVKHGRLQIVITAYASVPGIIQKFMLIPRMRTGCIVQMCSSCEAMMVEEHFKVYQLRMAIIMIFG